MAIRFARRGFPMALFGSCFAIIVMGIWGVGFAGREKPDSFVALFVVLLFMLLCAAMLCAPLWMIRKARNTVYVITDRRAIICYDGRRALIRSVRPWQLRGVKRAQNSDGSGDVILMQDVSRDPESEVPIFTDVSFSDVRDVRAVEKLVSDLAGRAADVRPGN
jgi:hypothetical protein